MKKTEFKGVFFLLLTAFIWGLSFVAQSVGMESIEAFTFTGIRTLLGAAVLFPFIIIKKQMNHTKNASKPWYSPAGGTHISSKKVVLYGVLLGLVFLIATNFQQFAFNYSNAGKIAFITTLYMFFVPFIGIFLKKKTPWLTWVCVLLGFIGLYFLCIDTHNMGHLNRGDIYAMICALFFAIHILLVEKLVTMIDGLILSFFQFAVAGILSCLLMFLLESPSIMAIKSAAIPLLYSGVLSCGLAYTLQIVGQKYTEASVASLLLCMESVFAVLASAIILKEKMTFREMGGCAIMFIAIIISQYVTNKNTKKQAK